MTVVIDVSIALKWKRTDPKQQERCFSKGRWRRQTG